MFQRKNNNNTYTAPVKQAQKSCKEKTMATRHTNSLAQIDITKELTLEEQALITQNNLENSNSVTTYPDSIADYYPGKYQKHVVVAEPPKEEEKRDGYITSYIGDYTSDTKTGIIANLGNDVAFVQKHLNRIGILSDKDYTSEKPTSDKEISKDAIPKTIEAINWFQSKVLHYNTKYGYVIPGKSTINKLAIISVEEKDTKYKEYLEKEKAKQKRIVEQKAKAEKEAEIERIKNEPATIQNLTKIYQKLGSIETFGKFLTDYITFNPEFVLKAYDLMDFGESDNLTRAIMYNLKDSEIEKLPEALDIKFYESLDAGWTVDEEYKLMEKLKAGKKLVAEKKEEVKNEKIERPAEKDVEKIYGKPGDQSNFTRISTPFTLYFGSSPVNSLMVHKKVAESLKNALSEILSHYGEKKLKELKIDKNYGGLYNLRKKRGGPTYSMHSWAIAIDLNHVENGLKMGSTKALFAKPEYKKLLDIMERNGWYSFGRAKGIDYMHFQAVKFK